MKTAIRSFGWVKGLSQSLRLIVLAVAVTLFPDSALAVGEALPYEAGINVLIVSLQGPVPFIISLVGIVACGAMLIFGGEISGFMRTMVFIVLVVSVIVQASTLISILGLKWKPVSGTVVVTSRPFTGKSN
ncbi:TrbC/VirB2 family protein [Luteibacter sp. dw_328]|uniref:TrbC/VirB2 family protein n=1 Tax=Luteibacter sp. dw_328 TaxID=2719796 RepID=UPI001BD30943|nr:TrbC/VirB2 family protein [Luteibacter sp. dw_328]